MEIEVLRNTFSKKSTISNVIVNGKSECYFLEDCDRGLTSDMPLELIKKIKVFGQTCIPYGRYRVIVTKSERFSKLAGHDVYLPLIMNVPGYDGVRIHSGTKPEDTEGCPLTGTEKNTDNVSNSRTAFIKINDKINLALKTEEVWITFKKAA